MISLEIGDHAKLQSSGVLEVDRLVLLFLLLSKRRLYHTQLRVIVFRYPLTNGNRAEFGRIERGLGTEDC